MTQNLEIEKNMRNFLFWLPNVEILNKHGIFSVESKQKGKYVKKQFLVS